VGVGGVFYETSGLGEETRGGKEGSVLLIHVSMGVKGNLSIE